MLSSNGGCCLAVSRFLFFWLVVGASRFDVVAVLPFPAVAGVMPLLSAMSAITASRCCSHGFATTTDFGVAVARKIVQVKMAHRASHLIDIERRVSVHHHLGVLVLGRESLNT